MVSFAKKNFAEMKNHVGGNFSQMMRIISGEREKISIRFACSCKEQFSRFSTLSLVEKMGAGGERGSYNQALRKEEPVCQIVIMERVRSFTSKDCPFENFDFACKRKKI